MKLWCANNPKKWAGFVFQYKFGRPLNWDAPKDLNEKINWLKFNRDTTLWTELSDKYRMKKYVEERGFGQYIPKLYGQWDRAEDVNWDSLPNQFVMKVNNGSGDVIICKDKSHFDCKAAKEQMKKLLKTKFGNKMAEPHYNRIRPCIFAEEYLDPQLQNEKSNCLTDYKIWVFNGKPAFIMACTDRTPEMLYLSLYDLEWHFLPQYLINTRHLTSRTTPIAKPKCLDMMLRIASELSFNEPQVRVDFYEVGGKPYLGELTFTAFAGFIDYYSQEFLDMLGDLCNIDNSL